MAPALPAGVAAKHLVAIGHQDVGIQCDGVTELDGSEVVLPQGSAALVRGLASFELPRGRSSLGFLSPRGLAQVSLGVGSIRGGAGTHAHCNMHSHSYKSMISLSQGYLPLPKRC